MLVAGGFEFFKGIRLAGYLGEAGSESCTALRCQSAPSDYTVDSF